MWVIKCFLKQYGHLYESTCILFLHKYQRCFNFPEYLIDIIYCNGRFVQNHVLWKQRFLSSCICQKAKQEKLQWAAPCTLKETVCSNVWWLLHIDKAYHSDNWDLKPRPWCFILSCTLCAQCKRDYYPVFSCLCLSKDKMSPSLLMFCFWYSCRVSVALI